MEPLILQNRNASLHHNLSQWIIENGGNIHKSLTLCTPDEIDEHSSISTSTKEKSRGNRNYSQRGIFARHPISKGEELIRLPQTLALDGKDLPEQYSNDGQKKNASPWLRCLASLLQAWHIWQSDGSIIRNGRSDVKKKYSKYTPYLESLPQTYDSLLNWSSWELRTFLAGTALGTFALSDIETKHAIQQYDADKEDDVLENVLLKWYESTVKPYLEYLMNHGFFMSADNKSDNGNDDGGADVSSSPKTKRQRVENDHDTSIKDLYNFFRQGCMCISTRAFHMQSAPSLDTSNYQGPYLLSYIDLLNHAPRLSSKHMTTLRRDPKDGSFVMVAERDIDKGDEICHSYDCGGQMDDIVEASIEKDGSSEMKQSESSSLNSAQLLQTFGFVDLKSAVERLSCWIGKDKLRSSLLTDSQPSNSNSNLTPAMLTKQDISQNCKAVSLSSYSTSVRQTMEDTGLVDEGWEYWDLPLLDNGTNKIDELVQSGSCGSSRQKALDTLPNEVIVPIEKPLSNEVITICALTFLPDEAIDELLGDSSGNIGNQQQTSILLTEEVLDDYFLGKLVLHSIIQVVDEKLKKYRVCFNDGETMGSRRNTKGALDAFLHFVQAFSWGESEVKDFNLLSKLVASNSTASKDDSSPRDIIHKFMCGMTVSLEERACLMQLKRDALEKLLQLDDS